MGEVTLIACGDCGMIFGCFGPGYSEMCGNCLHVNGSCPVSQDRRRVFDLQISLIAGPSICSMCDPEQSSQRKSSWENLVGGLNEENSTLFL